LHNYFIKFVTVQSTQSHKANQNFSCIFLGDDCRTDAEMTGKELEDKYRKLQHN